jgi:DNA invertase Pin-like site-specific DNA recombinase
MAGSCSPSWGGLAEFERTLIRARTGEGRERAKVRGVRFGRPKKLTAHQRQEAVERVAAGEAVAEVARTFGVDRATYIARQRLCRLIESDLDRLTAEVLNQMSIDGFADRPSPEEITCIPR